MATQNFLSDLWDRYGLVYKNEAIFKSHNSQPTPQSSTTLTPQPSNPDQSIVQGAHAHSYQAPVQEIYIYPPTQPPMMRQNNEMSPLQQKAENLAYESIAPPDPRQNIIGNNVHYPERLENMDMQFTSFNYPAIWGIIGILAAFVAFFWLMRGRGKSG